MAKFNHHHRLLPGMKPRPEVVLVDKNDEEEKLKSESSATFLLIKNCSNYSLIWYGKVAKIMCENCRNLKIVLSESPITGTVEVYKSKTVVVGLTQFCQIPIFQIDDSTDVRIEVCDKSLIKSIYFQRSNDIKVISYGQEKSEIVINTSLHAEQSDVDDIPQWVAHWNVDFSAFITEKLKRNGIYPLAEQREPKNIE